MHSDERSRDFLERLKKVECSDSTYAAMDPALVFGRARGAVVVDVDGNQYVDLCAGFGVHALGHNPKVFDQIWVDLLRDEYPQVIHAMGDVYASQDKVLLIETLLAALPSYFDSVALALSGSQAIEIAMKTAMLAKKSAGFICFEHAYHGLDLGSLNLTFRQDFRDPFIGMLSPAKVCFAKNMNDEDEQLTELDKCLAQLQREGQYPAAVVVETIQGRAGVRPRSLPWMKSLRSWCDRHGVLLVYDEIFTGLGRAGRMSYAELVPSDLSCFGKALGGGLPLSACVGSNEVMRAWPENHGEAIHTGTFFGHPLSCRLGTLVLREIANQRLCERAEVLGLKCLSWLSDELSSHAIVKDIRGKGLMMGIAFDQPGVAVRLFDRLRKKGIIALPSGADGSCLSLTPPLNIDEAQLISALNTVKSEILSI
jgi:4-aminobutyrate aminotransferase-like enzyme